MDAYDRRTNIGEKNLAESVDIYGRGREPFRPPTYEHNGDGTSKESPPLSSICFVIGILSSY